jgi:LuxR family maltose regulon positive regulatory protein
VDRPGNLYLDGRAATVHQLLAGFPVELSAADAELAVVAAADELAQGSLEAAERYLALAEQHAASVPAGRGEYGRLLVGVVRLLLERQRGNLPAVAAAARELRAMAEVADAARPGLAADLGALALISLGSTEIMATRPMTPSAAWKAASRWPAGSGGPTWSSPGWLTRPRTSSTTRGSGWPNAAGRRWSWPWT